MPIFRWIRVYRCRSLRIDVLFHPSIKNQTGPIFVASEDKSKKPCPGPEKEQQAP